LIAKSGQQESRSRVAVANATLFGCRCPEEWIGLPVAGAVLRFNRASGARRTTRPACNQQFHRTFVGSSSIPERSAGYLRMEEWRRIAHGDSERRLRATRSGYDDPAPAAHRAAVRLAAGDDFWRGRGQLQVVLS
jgi:hypothetical protein